MEGKDIGLILALAGKGGGGGGSHGIFVGSINENSAMPTKRPDGSALQNEDYVRVDSYANVPFSIGNLRFETRSDKAVFYASAWMLEPGVLQDTSETPVKNKDAESLSGEAATQAEVNEESVEKFGEIDENFDELNEKLEKKFDKADISTEIDELADNKHVPSDKTVKNFVEREISEQKIFRFCGFFGSESPDFAEAGDLWFGCESLPEEFPIECIVFDGEEWTGQPISYSAERFDLWKFGEKKFYFDDGWKELGGDGTIDPDMTTIDKNAQGKLQIAESLQEKIDGALQTKQGAGNKDKVPVVNAQGDLELQDLPEGVKIYNLIDGYVLDKTKRVLFSEILNTCYTATFTDLNSDTAPNGRCFRYNGMINNVSTGISILLTNAGDINPSRSGSLCGNSLAIITMTDDGYAQYEISEYGGLNTNAELQVVESTYAQDGKPFDILTGNGIAKVLKKENGESDIPTSGNNVITTLKDILVQKEWTDSDKGKVLKIGSDKKVVALDVGMELVNANFIHDKTNGVTRPDLTSEQIVEACRKYHEEKTKTVFMCNDTGSAQKMYCEVIGAIIQSGRDFSILVSVPGYDFLEGDDCPACKVRYTWDSSFNMGHVTVYKNPIPLQVFNVSDVFTDGAILKLSTINQDTYKVYVLNECWLKANLYFNSSVAAGGTGWKTLLNLNDNWKYTYAGDPTDLSKTNIVQRLGGSMWYNNAYGNMAHEILLGSGLRSYYYQAIQSQTGGVNMQLSIPLAIRTQNK